MSVEDPFFSVRDDVLTAIRNAENLYDRHLELSQESPTTTRQEREWLCTELRNSLRSIDWDLEDLDQTVSIVSKNPRRWRLTPEDVAQRKQFIQNSREKANDIRLKMAASDSRFKDRNLFSGSPKESPLLQRANPSQQYRYSRLQNEPDSASDKFVTDNFERQQLIIASQDDDLEKIGTSVSVLKDMSHRIGGELDEHSVMLEDISREMDRTETKLDTVMRKLAKVTHLSSDKRQWYVIIALVVILFVVILLFFILG